MFWWIQDSTDKISNLDNAKVAKELLLDTIDLKQESRYEITLLTKGVIQNKKINYFRGILKNGNH